MYINTLYDIQQEYCSVLYKNLFRPITTDLVPAKISEKPPAVAAPRQCALTKGRWSCHSRAAFTPSPNPQNPQISQQIPCFFVPIREIRVSFTRLLTYRHKMCTDPFFRSSRGNEALTKFRCRCNRSWPIRPIRPVRPISLLTPSRPAFTPSPTPKKPQTPNKSGCFSC
jgi:hypothetical protein